MGGSVRDHLLGRRPKDMDIEVHGLPLDDLQATLSGRGPLNAVGKSFGVFKLKLGGEELDISLPQPRRDANNTAGMKGDPHMGLTAALRRRDLTINAMAYDPLQEELADPFNGRADLAAGILREVDVQTFAEDPLRVLRVVQFAARFGFAATAQLTELCRSLPLANLPGERIFVELEKLFLKSKQPGIGLRTSQQAAVFSRLFDAHCALDSAPLGAALDRAAGQRRQHMPPIALMLATWLHACTPAEAERILERLNVFTQSGYPLRQRVLFAIQHWEALSLTTASDAELRWMAEGSALALTARVAHVVSESPTALHALHRANQMGLANRPLPPLLKGRDLAKLGIPHGPIMGTLLREVRGAQLNGDVETKVDAIEHCTRLWNTHTAQEGTG